MKKQTIGIILCGIVWGTGCTPDTYKRWADSEVGDILRDRKQETLGYHPQVEAASTVPDVPGKAAYEKIPTTPIPPPAPPPFEESKVVVPYGALGPPEPKPDAITPPVSPNPYDRTAVQGHTLERLRLGPPVPGELRMQLDLFRSIEYAVQHSREYETAMEDLYLRTLDVTLQRHLFEPTPFVTQSYTYNGGQKDVAYASAMEAVTTAGVKQQLPYGGQIVAQTLMTAVQTLEGNVTDGQSAQVALSASIPLLRGAGMVNLEPLISSERELIYQVRQFETFRRNFAVGIATQYFNIIAQQLLLDDARRHYRSLVAQTAINEAQYEAGHMDFIQVQLSANNQLQQESAVVSQESSYQTALDNFKIVLGMPIETDMDVMPVELDLHIPEVEPVKAMELATQYRLDLQTARDQIEDARRQVANSKNGLLPDLSFTANYNVGSLAHDPLLDIQNQTQTYSAGLLLSLPVDRLRERNTYRASLISLQRAQRGYEELRDQIAVAARGALRDIATAQENLEIQRQGIKMAQAQIDFAWDMLHSDAPGMTYNARDLLDAQTSLQLAQDGYATAQSALQISILNYLNGTGTLRIDPQAGELGKAMDRAAAIQTNKMAEER